MNYEYFMSADTYVNSLMGWIDGYDYIREKNKEDEVKQGKNYYLIIFNQYSQLNRLATLIFKLNETLPSHPLKKSVSVLCNIIPLASLPFLGLCAAVKHGDYEKFVRYYNASSYSYMKLPERLTIRQTKMMDFCAEHTGDVARVAMISCVVALGILGNRAFAGAFLTAIAYTAIDQMGWVSQKISLFIETYMPTVSIIGLLFSGVRIAQFVSVCLLSTHAFPSINSYLHQKVDAAIRKHVPIDGPSLKEIEAPLIEKGDMSYEEIEQILNSDFQDYEINPSHCSHPLVQLDELPKDTEFSKFLPLFDSITWVNKYPLVFGKLKDDERFLDFLFQKISLNSDVAISKEEVITNPEIYFIKLAEINMMTKEEYAASWMRDQMISLVDILSGKRRVTGLQQDLSEAITDSSIVLPYLIALTNERELEDLLLKLAIEGGDYCGRGIRRALNEILRSVLEQTMPKEIIGDPQKSYEMQILQTLQSYRYNIIQNEYDNLNEKFHVPNTLSKDTHAFDLYRLYFSLGFYPLINYDKRQIDLSIVAVWETYGSTRERMYFHYKNQLHEAIRSKGEIHFGVYIANMIQSNSQLSDDQKEAILEGFIAEDNKAGSEIEVIEKYHTLFLVKHGILQPKKTQLS